FVTKDYHIKFSAPDAGLPPINRIVRFARLRVTPAGTRLRTNLDAARRTSPDAADDGGTRAPAGAPRPPPPPRATGGPHPPPRALAARAGRPAGVWGPGGSMEPPGPGEDMLSGGPPKP